MSIVLRKGFTWGLAAKCSSFYSVQRGLSSYSFHEDGFDESRQKFALVIGSSGCLGSTIVRYLATDMGMHVVGADIVGLPEGSNTSLNAFIELPTFSQPATVADVTAALVRGLSDVLGEEDEIDAIIVASGGFMSDPPFPKPDATDDEFMKGAQEYGASVNKMLEMNLYPVLAAGYAANRYMANEGEFFRYVSGSDFLSKSTITHALPIILSSIRFVCRHWSHGSAVSNSWDACLWIEQSRNTSFCSNSG